MLENKEEETIKQIQENILELAEMSFQSKAVKIEVEAG